MKRHQWEWCTGRRLSWLRGGGRRWLWATWGEWLGGERMLFPVLPEPLAERLLRRAGRENAPADRVARPAPLPVSVRWPIVRWWSWADGVAHARHYRSRGQAVCGARLHRNACYATGQTELCPACVEVLEATHG